MVLGGSLPQINLGVQGCDSGFGYYLAKQLHRKAYHVFAGCLSPDTSNAIEFKRECSQRLSLVHVDVARDESVHNAKELIEQVVLYQTLPWPARLPDPSLIEHVWDILGRRLHLPGNVDDLARQLEQIWQEIPQETIRVPYHSMPRRVAACILARGGSTPY
ncbi:transposable element Tcb1 transposase [Trichonephila clavipes]|nr:transposable element Tcb1 transposase [Trichonephila clavipes]